MITIDFKSTGMLLNEYITAGLKFKYIGSKPEFKQRILDIIQALEKRDIIFHDEESKLKIIKEDYNKLKEVLENLWWAVETTILLRKANQDDIDTIKKSGYAALAVFELNAERCNIVRQMDEKLGEQHITFLEKSY